MRQGRALPSSLCLDSSGLMMRNKDTVLRIILLFALLFPIESSIHVATAEEDMTSGLICPCECAMIISTCDCSTAIQIKKEISAMKEMGFSEKQVVSALSAEYGSEILAHPEKDGPASLWVAGIFLFFLLLFLGYILNKKPRLNIAPDKEKYERMFEEEYRKFVSEQEEI